MDKPSVPAYVNGPTGEMPVRPPSGEQPETNTTLNSWSHWHAHGLCRHCGKPVKRNDDGFWVHENGVLCEGRFVTAEPMTGIDMPGVGVVRLGDSPVCTGREADAGDEVREHPRYLVVGVSSLINAARALAEEQIESAAGIDPAFCTECLGEPSTSGAIAHEDKCRVGRVIEAIDDLSIHDSNEKENAADGERPRADDGNRPLGFEQLQAVSLSFEQFQGLITDLGKVVEKASPESAMLALEAVAAAFGCLLDIYAWPNDNNPAGMCDDKVAFRKYFALIIEGGAR